MLVYQRVLPILPQLSDGSPASPPLEHGAGRGSSLDSTQPLLGHWPPAWNELMMKIVGLNAHIYVYTYQFYFDVFM
jgi:hypothetical protein